MKNKIHRIDLKKSMIIICIFFVFGVFTHMAIGIKKSEYIELENKKESLTEEITKTNDEFDAYKDRLRIYESISIEDGKNRAEKEREEISNERKELEKKYTADRTNICEKAASEAFWSRGSENNYQKVSYDELAINPEKYFNKKVEVSCMPNKINRHDSGFYSIAANRDSATPVLISIVSAVLKNKIDHIRIGKSITVSGHFQGCCNMTNNYGEKVTVLIIEANNIEY